MVFEILTTYILWLRGRFGHFWWLEGHADRLVRLPACDFLLVFYSNHSSKCTVLEL